MAQQKLGNAPKMPSIITDRRGAVELAIETKRIGYHLSAVARAERRKQLSALEVCKIGDITQGEFRDRMSQVVSFWCSGVYSILP